MNKRNRNKIAKKQAETLAATQAEAHNAAPIGQRVRDDIAHGVAEVKQAFGKMVEDVRKEVVARAPDIEHRAGEIAKNIPVIGGAAAEKINELGAKLTDAIATDDEKRTQKRKEQEDRPTSAA